MMQYVLQQRELKAATKLSNYLFTINCPTNKKALRNENDEALFLLFITLLIVVSIARLQVQQKVHHF